MSIIHSSSQPVHIEPDKQANAVASKDKPINKLTGLFRELIPILNNISSNRVRITNKITSLSAEINKIQEKLKNSQQKILNLQGGRAARVPIIGAIIKYFNAKRINQEKVQERNFKKNIQEAEEHIQFLRQSLAEQEKLAENLASQIEGISKLPKGEDASEVFEIESQMRMVLEKDFPKKEIYQRLYREKILPLVQLAKRSITQRPMHFTVQAAAAKGKAAQAGLEALKKLAENKPVVKNSGVSSQQVFLLPKEGAVFKHRTQRAGEEEDNVNALFDLMSKQAVVGTFDIQKASTEEFGIEFSKESQARAFTPDNLSPVGLAAIKEKLSPTDRLLFDKHAITPRKINRDLANYQSVNKMKWVIQLPGEKQKPISFKELQQLYLSPDGLPPNALIQCSGLTLPFSSHMRIESPLFRALNYLIPSKSTPQEIHFIPDLSLPDDKNAYQACEKCRWSYLDKDGKKQVVDFKTLHSLFLQGSIAHEVKPESNGKPIPSMDEVNRALNVNWKAVSPELMKIESGAISALSGVQAKPFMREMILLKDLPIATRDILLRRLTPNAEFNAILTGEVQLLDLHSGNLAVAPEPNAAYERFKDLSFATDPVPGQAPINVNFKDLMTQYLTGALNRETIIQFEENGKVILKPLKDIPDLEKALNVRWDLVIFDTDLSLSEDNRLQIQTRGGATEHLVPLRSCLLESSWKDKPLNGEAIQRLIASDERDLRVKQWIKKEDAPIYKRLSTTARVSVEADIAPIIQKYSLSESRRVESDITIKTLQARFAKELSNISDPAHLRIWKNIETDLSFVSARPGDTLESIAKRYNQNIDEIRRLNPEGIKAGQKVKIKYDLTSATPEALKRREKIAAQLFPRITHRQQTAMIERQQCRKDYLNGYQALDRSTLTGAELSAELQAFIQKPTTPLSSVKKEDLINQIKAASPAELLKLKKEILQDCQPTYFNLMKAMYPLLADVYALNLALSDSEQEAGMNIGLYHQPLETSIAQAKLRFRRSSAQRRLVTAIETQIATVATPAFFGSWA